MIDPYGPHRYRKNIGNRWYGKNPPECAKRVELWCCPRCFLKWVKEEGETQVCPRCRRWKSRKIMPEDLGEREVRAIRFFGACQHGLIHPAICPRCDYMQRILISTPRK